MKKSTLSLLTLCLFIAACAKDGAHQVKSDLTASLQAADTAKSSFEFENGEQNPDSVFDGWKDQNINSATVCSALLDLSPQEASFYEEQIKSDKYQDMLNSCKGQLTDKIESYWAQQRQELAQYEQGSQVDSFFGFGRKKSDEKPPAPPVTPQKPAHPAPRPPAQPQPGPVANFPPFQFPDNVQTRNTTDGYIAVSGDTKTKEVVLTFDDGPHPQYTDMILQSLKKVNAKAIFFTLARQVKAIPDVLRREAAGGHSIGSHSIDHKCLAFKTICGRNQGNFGHILTYQEAVAEIDGGHQAVYDVLGWVDPFFRFPYGESSIELKDYLRKNSVGEFYWSIDSEDWKNRTPLQMINNTMTQLDHLQHGVILFHDIQRKTAESLPTILHLLYTKGYKPILLKPENPQDIYNSKIVQLKKSVP